MSRTFTLADGQLAVAAASILDGNTAGDGRISASFVNTGGSSETVVITFQRNGGTARQIIRAVLATLETLRITGLPIQAGDTLLGATTNASAVDYLVTGQADGELLIQCFDANGALKQVNTGVSGNQTISGNLAVTGTSALTGAVTFTVAPNAPVGGYKADGVTLSQLKWVDVTCTAALLDAAGTVVVIAGVAGDQYKIREIRLVGGGTNFGAGGDRLLDLTDGTTIWTTIANADIETAPAATLTWGNAKVPFLTGTSDTASASAANIRFQYSGGTTDHTTGSIKFSILLEKVA